MTTHPVELATTVRSLPLIPQWVRDLGSDRSRGYKPRHGNASSAPGRYVRVSSWNLHQGWGPQYQYQIDLMRTRLQTHPAEIWLLQEVAPWHVQSLVDATGFPGWYTMTTMKQGNLVLVHPAIPVEWQVKWLATTPKAPWKTVAEYLGSGGVQGEPRVVQILGVVLAGPCRIWNTHLTSRATQEQRLAEIRSVELGVGCPRGMRLIGGGDLNSTEDSLVLDELRRAGYACRGDGVDWICGRNVTSVIATAEIIRDPNGVQVSDHPMIVAEAYL